MANGSSTHQNHSGERKFSTSGESLYKCLGVEKGASAEQIKKAYRKLALQYHPDKNPDPNAAEKIRELNRANRVLGDEKQKAIYDKYGSLGLQIASQFGEDNVGVYYALDNVCFKILLGFCCVLTGCCCCCCCCFCCGKCFPDEPDAEENDYTFSQTTEDNDTGGDEPVTSQPQRSSMSDATERTRLTSDQDAKHYTTTG